MVYFVQSLIAGIMIGSLWGLIASGFVVVYKCTEIFNLAQGGFILLGGYVCWALLVQLGIPFWASLILSIVIMCILGVGLGRFPYRQMVGQSPDARFMVSLGLFALFPGIVNLIWGGSIRAFPEILPMKPLSLGVIKVSYEPLGAFLISLLIFGLIFLFFRYTKAGLRFSAAAESHKIAQSLGVSVNNAIAISVAIACGIIGVSAGILLGMIRGLDLSLELMALHGLAVALFGGLHSIGGAIVAGIIMGILETLVGAYISFELSTIVPYIVVVFVLLFRPNGLFGLATIERI